MKRISKLLVDKPRDLLVLTAAIYAEIAVSAFSLFRGVVPRPDPWLRGLPRHTSPLAD